MRRTPTWIVAAASLWLVISVTPMVLQAQQSADELAQKAANPIDRYLLNSPMLPDLVRDADGGITLYLQHDAPGQARQPNWLPAPEGPFSAVMRLYWPKAAALDGTWKLPPLTRVGN